MMPMTGWMVLMIETFVRWANAETPRPRERTRRLRQGLKR
jgi:hypothetical protein